MLVQKWVGLAMRRILWQEGRYGCCLAVLEELQWEKADSGVCVC